MNERRLRALQAICDTIVPAVEPPAGARGAHPDFWPRRASDLGTHRAVADHIDTHLPDRDRDGLWQLVDLLSFSGFPFMPAPLRERELRALRKVPGDVARGIDALIALTVMHFYGAGTVDDPNPNWSLGDYAGLPDVHPPERERLRPLTPTHGEVLEADVCVVGSGAGGAVVAAEAAAAGRSVVILEAGGYTDVHDVPEGEFDGFRRLYWRGFPSTTEDGVVTLLAGATLGGGTVVNWQNCVRPHAWVRAEWEQHGLAGVGGGEFDKHLDAVAERISVNTDCSDYNDWNSHVRDGAEALGWSWRCAARNVDPDLYDIDAAGYVTFGDRSGGKQDVLATYLRDAAADGARILVHTKADRVLLEGGCATGVQATHRAPGGHPTPVTVRATQVVAACGALETPALLLRSGIGGPAVGRHLRLHPTASFFAYYDEPQHGWTGGPQTVVIDEFAGTTDGYGYLLEAPHAYVTLGAALSPWWSARDHKLLVGRIGNLGPSIGLVRDRGSGRVTVDDQGEAVVSYPFDDPLDRSHFRSAIVAQARLHEAAGARAMISLGPKKVVWRRGRSLQAYLDATEGIPLRSAGGWAVSNAHQMGSARMGTDPATSVADPEGRLHDTPGVWVGDTSAFPSASGVNPMLTCMALARRTAQALLAAG